MFTDRDRFFLSAFFIFSTMIPFTYQLIKLNYIANKIDKVQEMLERIE